MPDRPPQPPSEERLRELAMQVFTLRSAVMTAQVMAHEALNANPERARELLRLVRDVVLDVDMAFTRAKKWADTAKIPVESAERGEHTAARAWARREGLEVSSRGRVPVAIIQAWRAAKDAQA